uniref:Uncharacterized protein n=1 Tax=Aegilops tauschii subsp. strangulata TaxID=200361 RepID=A0A452ZZC9_AEGTS
RGHETTVAAMASPAPATAKPIALRRPPVPVRGGFCPARPSMAAAAGRFRVSASASASDVPDFLSSDWLETRKKKPLGPRLNFNAEEAVEYQLEALKYNDKPRPDYGVEVMYRALIHLKGQLILDDSLILGSSSVSGGYFTIRLTECCLATKKERY